MGSNQKQIVRAATARRTQVEGEVLRALAGRRLAVSERPPSDGCEAGVIHADSGVPVPVP